MHCRTVDRAIYMCNFALLINFRQLHVMHTILIKSSRFTLLSSTCSSLIVSALSCCLRSLRIFSAGTQNQRDGAELSEPTIMTRHLFAEILTGVFHTKKEVANVLLDSEN